METNITPLYDGTRLAAINCRLCLSTLLSPFLAILYHEAIVFGRKSFLGSIRLELVERCVYLFQKVVLQVHEPVVEILAVLRHSGSLTEHVEGRNLRHDILHALREGLHGLPELAEIVVEVEILVGREKPGGADEVA